MISYSTTLELWWHIKVNRLMASHAASKYKGSLMDQQNSILQLVMDINAHLRWQEAKKCSRFHAVRIRLTGNRHLVSITLYLRKRQKPSSNPRCRFKNKDIICQFRKQSQMCYTFVLENKNHLSERKKCTRKLWTPRPMSGQASSCLLSAVSHCELHQ